MLSQNTVSPGRKRPDSTPKFPLYPAGKISAASVPQNRARVSSSSTCKSVVPA